MRRRIRQWHCICLSLVRNRNRTHNSTHTHTSCRYIRIHLLFGGGLQLFVCEPPQPRHPIDVKQTLRWLMSACRDFCFSPSPPGSQQNLQDITIKYTHVHSYIYVGLSLAPVNKLLIRLGNWLCCFVAFAMRFAYDALCRSGSSSKALLGNFAAQPACACDVCLCVYMCVCVMYELCSHASSGNESRQQLCNSNTQPTQRLG